MTAPVKSASYTIKAGSPQEAVEKFKAQLQYFDYSLDGLVIIGEPKAIGNEEYEIAYDHPENNANVITAQGSVKEEAGLREISGEQLREFVELAKNYQSWNELIHVLRKNISRNAINLKYPNLELKEYPDGKQRDWLVYILNIFGDAAVKGGQGVPGSLPRHFLVAKMAEAMDVTQKISEARLRTLQNGKWLQVGWGNVLFPKEHLMSAGGGA
jgi:hypothetical protein